MIKIFRDSPKQAISRLNERITEFNNLVSAGMTSVCLCVVCDHLFEWRENVWDCLAKDVETSWSQEGAVTECKQFRAMKNWQTIVINLQNEMFVDIAEVLEFNKEVEE